MNTKKILMLLLVLLPSMGAAQTGNGTASDSTSAGIDSVRDNKITFYPGFGVSLIRNELAPAFYISLGINHKERYEVNVNTASFFFFERDADKNYQIFRNTFLNLEYLLNFNPLNPDVRNWNGIGAGFLIESKGQYFRETTFMVYYKRRFKYISILPGLMLPDDFKDVFPVISIKI